MGHYWKLGLSFKEHKICPKNDSLAWAWVEAHIYSEDGLRPWMPWTGMECMEWNYTSSTTPPKLYITFIGAGAPIREVDAQPAGHTKGQFNSTSPLQFSADYIAAICLSVYY